MKVIIKSVNGDVRFEGEGPTGNEHLTLLEKEIQARKEKYGITPIQDLELSHHNLSGVNLQNVWLINCKLQSANLRSANLQNSCINNCNFRGADLRGANFDGAGAKI